MSNVRTLRHKETGSPMACDISILTDWLVYKHALDSGDFMDDDDLSAGVEPTEDELRAQIAAKREEYNALEKRQDELQVQIRALSKKLPQDESFALIVTPFDRRQS